MAWRDWHKAGLIAYIMGTLGTLIGADIIHLPAILSLPWPAGPQLEVASIGGAGTRDGIFVVGLMAVALDLLALALHRWEDSLKRRIKG